MTAPYRSPRTAPTVPASCRSLRRTSGGRRLFWRPRFQTRPAGEDCGSLTQTRIQIYSPVASRVVLRGTPHRAFCDHPGESTARMGSSGALDLDRLPQDLLGPIGGDHGAPAIRTKVAFRDPEQAPSTVRTPWAIIEKAIRVGGRVVQEGADEPSTNPSVDSHRPTSLAAHPPGRPTFRHLVPC
jgi:hypothetical protein